MENLVKRLLNPPENIELIETAISTFWMGEDGILCANNKPIERTVEHYKEVMNVFASFMKNGEKLLFMTDSSDILPFSKTVSEYISTELQKYIKVEAVILTVPLSGTLTKTFLRLNFMGMPVQLFSSVDEARKWLKSF